MLGVRFLDVDFMRIDLACGCRLLSLYTFIEQSERTMSANWNEGSIATPDDLVDQLVRDPSGSGRSESLTVRADNSSRLQRAWPRVGRTFYFEILVTAPLPKTCPKMALPA